jgi:hypothetical protein
MEDRYGLIWAKMKNRGRLAGEMVATSFRERGSFDDTSAARLLEIIASSPDDAETIFAHCRRD